MKQAISDLIEISRYAGGRVDYTQGGGGNTSVKDGDVMYIKASGFRLKDIDETTAYVPMNLPVIRDFINSITDGDSRDLEAENKKVTAEATMHAEGLAPLRPSVEVGFHSVLKKYVVHTHSVYANLLTCSVTGKEEAAKLFASADYGYIFMPYIDPGLTLSVSMKKALDGYRAENGRDAEVIFMQNHGLVVNADTAERVMAIHEDANGRIAAHFNLTPVKEVVLEERKEGVYASKTPYITHYLENHKFDKVLLDEFPLYPDQLVYLNNVIAFAPEKLKVEGGTVVYATNLKEATTLEETLFAYLFVLTTLRDKGYAVSTMSEKDVYFINHWEAEKYRRSLSK